MKGEAGSPYAIKDYYDVAPSLAENVGERDNRNSRTLSAGFTIRDSR